MKKAYLMYPPFIAFGEKFKVLIFSFFAMAGLLLMSISSRAQCPGWGLVGSGGITSANPQALTLAVTSTGTPYIYIVENWGTFPGMPPAGGFVKKYNGSSWENVGGPLNSVLTPSRGAMAIGPNDTAYVAYDNYTVTDSGAFFRATVKKFNGSEWVVVGDSNFSVGQPMAISITFDNSGVPYVFYGDEVDPYSGSTILTVKKFNGSAWVTVGDLGYSSVGVDPWGMSTATIKIAGDGTPYIAYFDGLLNVKKFNGTSWVSVGTISYDFTTSGPNILAINSSNIPYLAVIDAVDYTPHVIKFNGTTWDDMGEIFRIAYTSWVALAIDAHDNLHLSYDDYLLYSSGPPTISVKANYGDGWVYEGCARFHAAPDPGWPNYYNARIAIDPANGVPYVAFADSTYEQKVSVMKLDNCISTITGTKSACIGGTTTLRDTRTSGVWSSSNTSVAMVGTANGIVAGVASGTVTISYSYGAGCLATTIVTVGPFAGTITGPSSVPVGGFITLNNGGYSAGTWSSSNTSLATVNAGGVVTGVSEGMLTISYSKTSGCGTHTATKTVTVTPAAPLACPIWTTVGGGSGYAGDYSIPSSIVSDANGTPYVLYKNPANHKANVKKFNGSSWESVGSADFTLPIDEDYSWGSLAMDIDMNGTLYVAYCVSYYAFGSLYPPTLRVMKYDGSDWQAVGDERGIGFTQQCSIAIDKLGVPFVSYIAPGGALVVQKYIGSTWVAVGTPTTHGELYFPKIAIDLSGTPYVAFANYDLGFKGEMVKYDGSDWVMLGGTTFSAGWADFINVAIDPSGTPYVAFLDGANGNKATVMKFSGGSWSSVGGVGFTSSALYTHSSLALDGNGTPYLLYADELPEAHSTVVKYDGGSWVTVGNADFTNDPHWLSLAISGSGDLYALHTSPSGAVVNKLASGTVSAITGNTPVCTGASLSLSSATLGGTWTSSDTAIAKINSLTGVVTPVAAGTATISYSFASCGVSAIVTVNPGSGAGTITGAATLCVSGTTTLSNAVTGGAWSSANTAVATVGSTGVVSGISSGTAIISYSVASCGSATATQVVTVSATASAGTITGTATLCTSGTTTLGNATAGGTWSSGNTSVATVGSADGVVAGITSGTATITYSVSAACGTATTTKIVTVNGAPSAGTITGTATVCESATTTLSNAVTGGVWTSGNTSVATIGSSSGSVTGVTNGNATITYTVTNSCGSNTATKVVTVNSTPSVGTITGTLSVCTSSTTTLDNVTTGGVWTSGNTSIATIGSSTGIVSGVASGNVNITYMVTSGCGTASTTATVTVNAAPSSIGSITGTLSFCAGATSTLANSASGGTWVSSNTSVATVGSSNGVVSGVAGGNTTITYILTNECGSATTTAVVTVNGSPSVSGITGTLSVCVGATTSLNNATGGGVWSSSNTAKGTISGAGVVSGISAGTTTISYTVSNSCGSNAATTIVTVNPAPNAGSITGSSSVSTGSTITLSNAATGGAWSSSNSNATVNSSGVVTGVTVGTATISYTVTNSCGTAVAIKVITINSSLSGITGSMAICVGGTTTLSIAETGGTWSSSNTLFATVGSSSGIVTGITPGTVTISYTLDGGTVTAVVTVNGNPAITSGSLSACPGNTITLSGAPSGGVWSSSTPGVATVSGGVVSGASSGTSTISYTNASGCAASVIVTINASPATISGSPMLCVGSTVTYTNSTGGGTWSGSSTSVIDGPGGTGAVTGMSAGTAIITYNTAGGCKAVLTITVNGIPANITGTLKACPGTSTTLGSSTSGGTWSSASTGIATIGSSSGIVTGVLAGTADISYSLGTGCAKTAVVTINANPSASVAGSTTICIGLNTTMTNSTPGMVSWTSSNTSVATVLSTGVVNGIAAGTSNITYTVGGGCYTTTQITVNAKPTINGATSVCPGSIITLTSPTAGGTWSSSNTSAATIGSSTGALTGVSAGGSTVITYSLGASCYQVRSEAVSTLPLAIGGYAIACEGTSTTLTHSNAGTWSSGDASVASVGTPTVGIVTGVNAGTTNITFTLNSTGCTTTKVVTVNTVPPAITGTGLVCVGLQTTLANAQTGGSWSSSNTYYANVGSANGIVTASTSAGTATISYSYGANCRTTTVVTVRAVPATILGPSSVCIGSTVTFSNSTGNGTWSSSNPTAATVVPGSSSYYGAVTGAGAGVTTLTYTNAPSCTRTQTVTVAACRGVNTTGIENANHNVAVSLFPNPTTGSFTVSAHVNGTLSVYTLEGREVSKHEINKGETQISLPNELSRGIYMCRFNGEDGSAVMVRLVVE